MLFERTWILREFSSAFESDVGLESTLSQLGVGTNDSHVSFMVLFAIAVDRVRNLNDEMCGLTDRKVPFGTWEMMVRSMSTARTLDKATYTLIQASQVFCLPYTIFLHDRGEAVFLEIQIHGKKNPNTSFLEAAYARLIWAAFCWFSGRQIQLLEIANSPAYYEADNRDAAGAPVRPFRSNQPGIPSLLVSDLSGFTFHKADLGIRSAIRRDSEPLIECFKWFGTLDLSASAKIGGSHFPHMNTIADREYNAQPGLFSNSAARNFKDARIIQAKVILSSTSKSLSEIAFDLGFSNEQNFRKVFQKATGETPTQYRERYEKGALLGSDHLLDQILAGLK